jgi:hypothetical protein
MTAIRQGRAIALNVDAVDWIDISADGKQFYVKMRCGTTIKTESITM